jgi:tRNA(Ile)-lysidine synthase
LYLLTESIINFLATSKCKRVWVAYSGGVDSHVLLHCLASMRPANYELLAIHINHSLSNQAEKWAQHCAIVCQQLEIAYFVREVQVIVPPRTSLEAAAREARYQAIQELIEDGDIVVTAQHADDQAETLLLQLFRGSGVPGLAAMPVWSKLGTGQLGRPLLSCTREQILNYALEHNLTWIEDESNINLRFERNFLRQQIMPQLINRWPKLNLTLVRAAQHQAQASLLLDEYAAIDLQTCINPNNSLNLDELANFPHYRQNNILRYWLKNLAFPTPSTAQLQQIIQQVINAKNHTQPLISWSGIELRRYRNQLFALPNLPAVNNNIITWHPSQNLNLNLGKLQAWPSANYPCPASLYLNSAVTVKFRRGGESIYIRGHRHKVKKILQQLPLPAWLRAFVPLIYVGDRLVAIPMLGPNQAAIIDEDYNFNTAKEPKAQAWCLQWQYSILG